MAARLSAKRPPRYSLEFKRRAVKPTEIPGLEVEVVAKALDLHPVMLSRWRQEAREGRHCGASSHGPKRPVEIWVADVTYLPVQDIWFYLAVVMDQCSRRILGCRLKSKRGTAITRTALDLATVGASTQAQFWETASRRLASFRA